MANWPERKTGYSQTIWRFVIDGFKRQSKRVIFVNGRVVLC